jgi:hypothetical protein
MRLLGASTKPGPLARIALVQLDGHIACARDVGPDLLTADRFTTVAVPCRLLTDTPATLAVFTLGVADLAIDTVRLTWTSTPPARTP